MSTATAVGPAPANRKAKKQPSEYASNGQTSGGGDSYGTIRTTSAFTDSPDDMFIPADKDFKSRVKELEVGQRMAFEYLRTEIKRQPRSFYLGWFTVFLVVFFVALLHSSVLKSPVIFFKVSESTVGENDLIMTPGRGLKGEITELPDLLLINQTLLDVAFKTYKGGDNNIAGTAPRWLLLGDIENRNLPADASFGADRASAIILGVDDAREKAIEMGRDWTRPKLATDECYLSRSVARQLGLTSTTGIGAEVVFVLDVVTLLGTVGLSADAEESEDQEELSEAQALFYSVFPGSNVLWETPIDTSGLTDFNITGLFTGLLDTSGSSGSDALIFNNTQDILDILEDNGLDTTTTLLFNLSLGDFVELGVDSVPENTTLLDEETLNVIVNGAVESLFLGDDGVFVNLTIGSIVDANFDLISDALQLEQTYTIKDIVDTPEGKWAEAIGGVMMLELTGLTETVEDLLTGLVDFNISGTIDLTDVGFFDLGLGDDTTVEFTLPGLEFITIETLLDFANLSALADNVTEGADALSEFVETLDLTSSAITSIVQYQNRLDAYLGNLDEMTSHLIKFTDEVAMAAGVNLPVSNLLPIAAALEGTIFIRYFLDNTFGAIVSLVVALGGLLIYALLLNDVSGKTYEYGMLRALGMTQRTLVQILITKAFMFSFLGIVSGLLLTLLVNLPVEAIISDYSSIAPNFSIAGIAVLSSVLVGLVMPLLANIVPIERALSKTLRDSLDVYHHVVSDVTVRVVKLAELGLDLWQTALAVLLIVTGFITFYLIPYSFTFGDIPLFLNILTTILMGMLVGLCMLSLVVQPYLERLILKVITFPKHRHLHDLVQKNLFGHGTRNRKTGLMFTLCLGFVIFAGVMLNLQGDSLGDNVKSFIGADISIDAGSWSNRLLEEELRTVLEAEFLRSDTVLVDYTFVSFSLFDYQAANDAGSVDVEFSNLPQFPIINPFVYAVESNYGEVTNGQFTILTETNPNDNIPTTSQGYLDPVRLLYTDAGNAVFADEKGGINVPEPVQTGHLWSWDIHDNEALKSADNYTLEDSYVSYLDVIASESVSDYMSVTLETPLYLRAFGSGPGVSTHLCKPRVMASKIPGFFFSSYRATAEFSPVLMSTDNFATILEDLGELSASNGNIEKRRLLIKVTNDATVDEREDLINSLRTFFRTDQTLATDTLTLLNSANDAVELMQLFFIVVGVISMALCFVILWLSFTSNVTENGWEFGVLRAVGLNSVEIVMVYVYEALSIVSASILCGTVIGLLIASSLTLQFNLFTEMPFKLSFPYALFFSMISMALVVAVAGSALPARKFLKRTISDVIRRQ